MALIVMPALLSKRPWARIRARCEASFFIVLSKSARCCSVRGRTYLMLIALEMGFTYHIVLEVEREIFYQKTFGRALRSSGTCGLSVRHRHGCGSRSVYSAAACGSQTRGDTRRRGLGGSHT